MSDQEEKTKEPAVARSRDDLVKVISNQNEKIESLSKTVEEYRQIELRGTRRKDLVRNAAYWTVLRYLGKDFDKALAVCLEEYRDRGKPSVESLFYLAGAFAKRLTKFPVIGLLLAIVPCVFMISQTCLMCQQNSRLSAQNELLATQNKSLRYQPTSDQLDIRNSLLAEIDEIDRVIGDFGVADDRLRGIIYRPIQIKFQEGRNVPPLTLFNRYYTKVDRDALEKAVSREILGETPSSTPIRRYKVPIKEKTITVYSYCTSPCEYIYTGGTEMVYATTSEYHKCTILSWADMFSTKEIETVELSRRHIQLLKHFYSDIDTVVSSTSYQASVERASAVCVIDTELFHRFREGINGFALVARMFDEFDEDLSLKSGHGSFPISVPRALKIAEISAAIHFTSVGAKTTDRSVRGLFGPFAKSVADLIEAEREVIKACEVTRDETLNEVQEYNTNRRTSEGLSKKNSATVPDGGLVVDAHSVQGSEADGNCSDSD